MVDMHIHTTNSDGEKTIQEIIQIIQKNNIEIFSLTDHDNINSCYEMEKIILPNNIEYIPGIEFSSKNNQYNCHILGYNFDYYNKNIIEECNIIRNKRYQRILKIIENLYQNFNIEITEEEKKSILNKKGTFGRPDLYKILLNRGYGTKEEIFDKYLTAPPNIDHKSEASHIINIIHEANGKAILAHPKEIEEEYKIEFASIIKSFLEIGIDGIEIYNSIHDLKDVKRYLALAQKYNLLTTGGSDYHGPIIKPNIEIGYTTKQKIKIYKEDINFHK